MNNVINAMERLGTAMESLKNVIPYYHGTAGECIQYYFNYTNLNNTIKEQEQAVKAITDFVHEHGGLIISTMNFGITAVFPVEREV